MERTLEDMLRIYVGNIGISPFFLHCMDKSVGLRFHFQTPNSRFESINQMVREMNEVIESLKVSMKGSQERAKHYVEVFVNLRWETKSF